MPVRRPSSGSPQPRSGPSVMPKTSAASAAAERSAPTRSIRGGRASRVAGTIASVPMSAMVARTTLKTKIDCHGSHSSITPEASNPSTPPPAATPTHVPTALPRSSGGKTVVITDSVTGMIIAAPTPIAPRSAISSPGPFAKMAASEERPKRPRPAARTGLRPIRSPIAPAGRSSAAKANAYAVTIHCSCVCEAPVLRAISGSATFRLATAPTTIISARHMTLSTAPRCFRSSWKSLLPGIASLLW